MLDHNWAYLEYAIQVTKKPTKKEVFQPVLYDSIEMAMEDLGLKGKPVGAIMASLTGKKEWVYGYNWQLVKQQINN